MASFSPFVPAASAVSLGGSVSSAVVPVRGLGLRGAVVEGSDLSPDGSRFFVWFVGVPEPLVCLRAAFAAPADFVSCVKSVASAGAAGVPVFPVVAVGASGVAASGYFCGLDSVSPSGAPVRKSGVFV